MGCPWGACEYLSSMPYSPQPAIARMARPTHSKLLDPIEGLEFHEEKHRYRFKGQWINSSPTTVLGHDMDSYAKQKIEETRHIWQPRGNTLHSCLEQYLLGSAELDPGEYVDWWEPLKKCWLWEDAVVMGVELRLVDAKASLAGSTDFLLKTAKGSVVLGDLKTCATASATKSRKNADAQLGAYLKMLNQNYPGIYVDRCVTVVSGPGLCRVISSEPDVCSLAWEDALSKYNAVQDLLGF